MPGGAMAAHFSTDDFREHERVAAWREAFGRTLLKIDIAPRPGERFHASASLFCSEALGVLRAATSPVDQSNSRGMITNDNVTFGWGLSKSWSASQLGRDADLRSGDGVLLSNGEVGGLAFPEGCRYVAFSIPKSLLEPQVPDIGALFAHRIPGSNPTLTMLMRYLDLGQDEHVSVDPALRAAFTDHVCDLLALVLGATRDATETAQRRGVAAARLQVMKEDICRFARRPDLSVHTVAQRHGVSPRYVQRVFEESGSTFTQYLAEQRLAAAHKALRRASSALPIGTIALDCGFSDVSHFNRLFRQRFGCTPSDVRKRARIDGR
jgi:AraC-like DNA-binding protein